VSGEILVGVSACLLGEEVRYDGGHKRNAFLISELGRHVRFVPLCPEVGIGLGTPREPIRLIRAGGEIRLVGESGPDHTEAMRAWAEAAVADLRGRDLSGYVLKKGSPSCGLERVKVWHEGGEGFSSDGRGMFAQALVDALPTLPIEEEGRLNDPALREHFVERVFGHARVRDFFAEAWAADDLVRFHSAEKIAVLAHDTDGARELGRLVATCAERPPEETARRYRELHARALAKPATSGRQANALMHLAGHLKDALGPEDRQELHEAIDDYRTGLVPVAVPLALLRRHLRAVGAEWASAQRYLDPYPKDLGLRGRIARRPNRGA
jgi:uncharacterized protein YbbK (DUF523 family)/uncharacterized protein YbgA (DUF1722 family)